MSDDVPPSPPDRRSAHALQEKTWPQARRAQDLVERERLTAAALRPYPYPYSDHDATLSVTVPFSFAALTENGAFGDARQADAMFGRAIAEAVVERAAAFLRSFIASSPGSPALNVSDGVE